VDEEGETETKTRKIPHWVGIKSPPLSWRNQQAAT
jgi:hypothetical protein